MNMRWLNFPFQPNINVETTLSHQHWIKVVTLSKLFHRCFVNVETTSINIRLFNFHFQPNFNVETTLVHLRWIDVILSTLFQRCFLNIETTSINVNRLNFHFQPNIKVETTLMNVDDQRCFNVDSMLMCLLGLPKDLHFSKGIFSGLIFCAAYNRTVDFQMWRLREGLVNKLRKLLLTKERNDDIKQPKTT